ncbi:MAG: NADH-quinone oxidoreductase subunit C [Desulfovibrionaceae bacterium]|nr:NADH-quinone oxidoreductase subunit C [Desulfovibrionaceae bacterium]
MIVLENVTEVSLDNVREEVAAAIEQGWRFVTITAVDLNENEFEFIYHFHNPEFEIKNLRLTFPKGTVVPSVSGVLFCALLVENEIKDLFHIDFEGLALDYNGTFYTNVDELEEGERMIAPFATFTTVQKNKD